MFLASTWSFSHLRSVLLDRVILFREILGDQEKCRSPKKLKSLMNVPYVAYLKVQVLSFNVNLISSPLRIPWPSYPFRGKLGRSGKGSFTEKAKIVDRIPYVAHLKVHTLSFNVNNVFFCRVFIDQVIHFGKKFGISGKGSFKNKEISLIEVSCDLKWKNMFWASIWSLSYLRSLFLDRVIYFRWKYGRSDKGSFTEEAKIINWGSLCSAHESTGSMLHYEPYLFSVACSLT